MIVSKSDYIAYQHCRRKFYLRAHKPGLANQDISSIRRAKLGIEVGELAKDLFDHVYHVDIQADKQLMIKQTQVLIEKGVSVIAEASFQYKDLFCSVDFFEQGPEGVRIYEVKSATKIKPVHLDDLAFQVYILEKLGIHVEKACIIHINKQYIRKEVLDLHGLYMVKNVLEDLQHRMKDISSHISMIRQMDKEPDFLPISHCSECDFKNYCFSDLPEDSLLYLYRYMKKTKLYKAGLRTFKDILKADISLNDIQRRQIDFFYGQKKSYIDHTALGKWLSSLSEKRYFLDFETLDYPIPPFKGTYPNQRLPFQASIHTQIGSQGKLKHNDILLMSNDDPREKMAEFLVEVIDTDGVVIVYNASFEKSVIRNLIDQVPKYAKRLKLIYQRIIDLLDVFRQGMVYDKDMGGSFSIKKVYPAMCKEAKNTYTSLDQVHNGIEAMAALEDLPYLESKEKHLLMDHLKAYCALDTLSMVDILSVLEDLSKSS